MPVHNAGKYLADAVDSILKQENIDLELIIIDDHSHDGAIQALPDDARIRVLKSPSRGIVPALNHGLAHAKGHWLARMDGDDICAPERLSKQVNYLLEHPYIDICGTQVDIFKNNGPADEGYRRYQKWINAQITPEQIHHAFFVESCIPHPSALMRTQQLIELGGYNNSEWPEDYDLWCRCFVGGLKFGKPEGLLLKWRDYQTRTSRQDQRYAKHQFLRCKAHYLARYLKDKNITECCIWGTGPTGLKLHDYLQLEGIEVNGFADINSKMNGRRKRNKPITIVSDTFKANELKQFNHMNIIAVSSRGAREHICSALLARGWQQHKEFILSA